MVINSIITLESLTCLKESDASGHSEPYIWPVLLKIDSDTLATDELLEVFTPTFGNERVPIRNGIRPGETAEIPREAGVLKAKFEEDQQFQQLLLTVALWEEDETPEDVVQDGFRAFADELGEAIRENLFSLSLATGEDREFIIETIKTRVKKRVKLAIENSLSTSEKIRIFLGTLNLDDIVGSEFQSFDSPLQPPLPEFTLTFQSGDRENPSEHYTIQGHLTAQEVEEEPCEKQVKSVKKARKAVQGIQSRIELLQAELRNASPQIKAGLIKQIRKLKREDLQKAESRLNAALKSLKLCRLRNDKLHDLETDVDVIPIKI